MAGLLLGDYNILILDEPGNHLDVETVEALASALLKYKGTVLFTSHDRHFATAGAWFRDNKVGVAITDPSFTDGQILQTALFDQCSSA